jgi:hypothetical protein
MPQRRSTIDYADVSNEPLQQAKKRRVTRKTPVEMPYEPIKVPRQNVARIRCIQHAKKKKKAIKRSCTEQKKVEKDIEDKQEFEDSPFKSVMLSALRIGIYFLRASVKSGSCEVFLGYMVSASRRLWKRYHIEGT